MKIVQDDLWLCADCLLEAVNGDVSGIDDDKRAREVQAAVAALGRHLSPNFGEDATDEDDGVREFSWTPCSCCHSPLGGSRHRFALLAESEVKSLPTEDFGQLPLLMMKAFGLQGHQLTEQLPEDFMERLNLSAEGGNQEEGRSPYSVTGVRQMLSYWRVPCKPECRGWHILTRASKTGKTSVWIAECEDCKYEKHGCSFPELTTADVEQLPEAWQALVDVRAGRRAADEELTRMRAPYSIEQVRQMLADRKELCSPDCKGWDIFEASGTIGHDGLEIEACGECCQVLNDLDVRDDDVEQLPEAKIALDQAIAKAQAEIDAARKE